MKINKTIIDGQSLIELNDGEVVRIGEERKKLLPHMTIISESCNGVPYIEGANNTKLVLDEKVLARHILCAGAIGSGKSVTMYHIINGVRKHCNENDMFIFFDAKGDYLKEFYQDGDYVISNDINPPKGTVYWNVFEDIMAVDKEKREDVIREIAASLFKEDIENSSNPVFAAGARDIFSGILIAITRNMEITNEEWNNYKLVEWIKGASDKTIRILLKEHKDLKWIRSYISKDNKQSTNQSYLTHIYQNILSIFSGGFSKVGDFSINKAVNGGKGKAIFLEYDLSNGNILKPVYTLILDLAMKEILGRRAGKKYGSVYFILDEFPLIPQLNYMDNALNFGRSLGVKVIAGIQNMGQVENCYGDILGKSIISGFGTLFSFRLNDQKSRDVVQGRYGNNKVVINMLSNSADGIKDMYIDGRVIEDKDINDLSIGQCIVLPFNGEPFKFYPVMYKER